MGRLWHIHIMCMWEGVYFDQEVSVLMPTDVGCCRHSRRPTKALYWIHFASFIIDWVFILDLQTYSVSVSCHILDYAC